VGVSVSIAVVPVEVGDSAAVCTGVGVAVSSGVALSVGVKVGIVGFTA